MRGKGINYDTGFFPGGPDSRPDFDPETARRELRVIAEDLHCTAVRISGALPDRLEAAAQAAADAGLEVWFAPFPCETTREELLELLADCAQRAERIRAAGTEVVFVAGCETSLFCPGYFDGDDSYARIADPRQRRTGAVEPARGDHGLVQRLPGRGRRDGARALPREGDLRGRAVGVHRLAAVRLRVRGRLPRRRTTGTSSAEDVRAHFKHGKPVVATEFGCTPYVGSGDRGGMAWAILDHSVEPPGSTATICAARTSRSTYFTELYDVFEEAGVDSAFWFTFATFRALHDPADPRKDLDLAAYGTVKMTGPDSPELNWEPKKVFHTIAERYAAS